MPIECPVCKGKATATGGSRCLSEKTRKKWYTCKECKSQIPSLEETTRTIDYDGIITPSN